MPARAAILSVRDLVVEVEGPAGPLRAVNGVSLEVGPHEVLGIVGESGSGKSLTMLAVLGLLPRAARIAGGSVEFRGRDLLACSSRQRRELLGKEISIVFQDPMSSLNPVMRVGRQIAEMVRSHDRQLTRAQVRARVLELLESVRIPDPRSRYSSYPHELSGGMRQRIMIAIAMAHNPTLLVADEPTTALDVTIQAQILRMLSRLRREVGASMVLITHDLGVIAESTDHVAVMYSGRVVESGPVERLFSAPCHPYTVALLASSLPVGAQVAAARAIPGQPPSIGRRPSGCAFRPRCELRDGRDRCAAAVPPSLDLGGGSTVACHYHFEVGEWVRRSSAPEADASRDPDGPSPDQPALTSRP